MERKQRIYCALGGFLLGVLTASLVWLYLGQVSVAPAEENQTDVSADTGVADVSSSSELSTSQEENTSSSVPWPPADTWDSAAVYTGGDTVSFQGRRYQAD